MLSDVYVHVLPLAGRKTILGILTLFLAPILLPAKTEMLYFVSHWRVGKVALVVVVVLPTVYSTVEPPSDW